MIEITEGTQKKEKIVQKRTEQNRTEQNKK